MRKAPFAPPNAIWLLAISLALAGWLHYLLGVDDNGNVMQVSPDPMLSELRAALQSVRLGVTESADAVIDSKGLAENVTVMFKKLLSGSGAARETLKNYLR